MLQKKIKELNEFLNNPENYNKPNYEELKAYKNKLERGEVIILPIGTKVSQYQEDGCNIIEFFPKDAQCTPQSETRQYYDISEFIKESRILKRGDIIKLKPSQRYKEHHDFNIQSIAVFDSYSNCDLNLLLDIEETRIEKNILAISENFTIEPATKLELQTALEKHGFEYDFNKHELVKLEWVPKNGEMVYTTSLFYQDKYKQQLFVSSDIDWQTAYKLGFIHKTKEEAIQLTTDILAFVRERNSK